MHQQFDASQVSRILDQSLLYQCACPAQVCSTLLGLRDLYDYQMGCANETREDRRVHESIAAATEKAHAIMEACLAEVLEIERWDLATLTMPDSLKKRPSKAI